MKILVTIFFYFDKNYEHFNDPNTSYLAPTTAFPFVHAYPSFWPTKSQKHKWFMRCCFRGWIWSLLFQSMGDLYGAYRYPFESQKAARYRLWSERLNGKSYLESCESMRIDCYVITNTASSLAFLRGHNFLEGS